MTGGEDIYDLAVDAATVPLGADLDLRIDLIGDVL
jgi:hypothetical protein